MQRFILRQNIRRYGELIPLETDPRRRKLLLDLLASARRELSLLESVSRGLAPGVWLSPPERGLCAGSRRALARFQRDFESSPSPHLLLDPGPGLHIVDINRAYASATMTSPAKIAGERLFEVFPDNPDDPAADGVSNLFTSLKTAAETKSPDEMAVQRYDVRDASGRFVLRYWKPVNTPILNDEGELLFLLHHVEDVTAQTARNRH